MAQFSVAPKATTQWLKPLGAVLRRCVDEYAAGANPRELPIISKVSFSGELSLTGVDEREGYAGRLFRARAGQLIYSKIRAKQGSSCVVPAAVDEVAVSAEYPVYSINAEAAHPTYLQLLLHSRLVLDKLTALSHGGSTKTRVNPERFEQLEVPLPSLPIQQAIVTSWQQDQAAAQALLAEADGLEEKARAAFADALGVAGASRSKPRRAMALNWVDIERWAVDAARGGASPGVAARGPFPSVQLGDVLTRIQYGTSEKANTEGRGVPVLRMGNIQDGALDFARLKHVQLPPADVARWALSQGDLLVNRTNSKDLVGKCAVFAAQGTYVFASYLIRLQLDGQKVLPAFVAEVLNGPIGRRQIDALSRQIIGQANINSVELKSLWIPLPPLEVQQRLVDDLELATFKASDLREQSRNLRAAAQDKLECQLRGQPPKEPA